MKFLIAGVLMLAMVSFASRQATNQKTSEANDGQFR